MKKVLVGLFMVLSLNAFAAEPMDTKVVYRCESKSIGIVIAELKQPGIDPEAQYVPTLIRQDANGKYLETQVQNVSNQNFLNARKFESEGYFVLEAPSVSVDWNAHSSECYVRAPQAGFSLTIPFDHPERSYLTVVQSALNPRAELKRVSDFYYGSYAYFLDGQECSGDQSEESNESVHCVAQ
jgi:hypothetical protein